MPALTRGLFTSLLVLVACGETYDRPEGTRAPCEIEQVQVAPLTAAAGDTITLSSTGFACDYELERELVVEVALYQATSPPYVDLGEVTVARDGSFSAALTVPAATPAGVAEVYLTPETLDLSGPCPQDDSSCPLIGGTAELTVT